MYGLIEADQRIIATMAVQAVDTALKWELNILKHEVKKPFLPKGTKSSILTKSLYKGATKLVAPVAAAATAGVVHGTIKVKKNRRTLWQTKNLSTKALTKSSS